MYKIVVKINFKQIKNIFDMKVYKTSQHMKNYLRDLDACVSL